MFPASGNTTVIYWTLVLFTVEEKSIASQSNFTNVRVKRAERCPGKFQCRNGQCISRFDICDGAENCGDGSDEFHATCVKHRVKCANGIFQCAYGACVDTDKTCDGVKDCVDNSDELLPSCPGFRWLNGNFQKCGAKQFQCRNGQCIDKYIVCDGAKDCADGTDESVVQCSNAKFRCPRQSFKCAYGGCIDLTAVCDFKDDCADGSDEDHVLCDRDQSSVPPRTTRPPAVGQVITAPPPRPSGTTAPPRLSGTIVRPPPQTGTTAPKPSPSLPPMPPTRPANTNSCIIPLSAGTSYSLATCEGDTKCDLKPGDVVSGDLAIVFLKCQGSFVSPNDEMIYIVCNQGRWAPENHACVRVCRPLSSSSMNITCRYKDQTVSCLNNSRPGTKAHIRCREGYLPIGGPTLLENECLNSGEWLYPHQRCSYRCGTLNPRSQLDPLILYGVMANISYHPWNAGLYFVTKNQAEHVCGGTLITPYSILTAAHCLYRATGELVRPQDVKIGLAKYYRDWNERLDTDAQKMDVKSMYISPLYEGQDLHYLHDIAILELTRPVRLTRFVMPACIDTNRMYKLKLKMLGTVVGWGVNERGVPNPTLQKAQLPYYSRAECLRLTSSSEPIITKDKFCALNTGDINVQKGDSGEGVTFEFDGKHYVFGIVSILVRGAISTFTEVTYEEHLKFIQDILNMMARKYL